MAARADVGREQDLLALRACDLVDAVDELLPVVDPGQPADRLAAHDRQHAVDVGRERQVVRGAGRTARVQQAIEARLVEHPHGAPSLAVPPRPRTLPRRAGPWYFGGMTHPMIKRSCILLLLAMGAACEKSAPPKETPPSAASTPVTPPAPTPPPPNRDDIPAPSDVKAPPADAEKTASGLASKVLKPGTGKDKPSAADN